MLFLYFLPKFELIITETISSDDFLIIVTHSLFFVYLSTI